jgi:hypothetical protein
MVRRRAPKLPVTIEELQARLLSQAAQLDVIKSVLTDLLKHLSPPKKQRASKKRQPVTRYG